MTDILLARFGRYIDAAYAQTHNPCPANNAKLMKVRGELIQALNEADVKDLQHARMVEHVQRLEKQLELANARADANAASHSRLLDTLQPDPNNLKANLVYGYHLIEDALCVLTTTICWAACMGMVRLSTCNYDSRRHYTLRSWIKG